MNLGSLSKIIAGLGIISIALWYSVFSPLVDDFSRVRKNLETAKQQQTVELQKVKQLESLQKQYSSLGKELERISFMLPQDAAVNDLLVELEALITKSGVGLQKLEINEPKTVTRRSKEGANDLSSVQKAGIRISFVTTYEGLKNFLRLQERELRLMDVKKLSFSPGGRAEGSAGGSLIAGFLSVFTVSLDLNTYFKP